MAYDIVFDVVRRYARLADSAWNRGDFSSYEYFSMMCSHYIEKCEWEG